MLFVAAGPRLAWASVVWVYIKHGSTTADLLDE